jgi:hypothetical protein
MYDGRETSMCKRVTCLVLTEPFQDGPSSITIQTRDEDRPRYRGAIVLDLDPVANLRDADTSTEGHQDCVGGKGDQISDALAATNSRGAQESGAESDQESILSGWVLLARRSVVAVSIVSQIDIPIMMMCHVLMTYWMKQAN